MRIHETLATNRIPCEQIETERHLRSSHYWGVDYPGTIWPRIIHNTCGVALAPPRLPQGSLTPLLRGPIRSSCLGADGPDKVLNACLRLPPAGRKFVIRLDQHHSTDEVGFKAVHNNP
jgi:hypothetical protein